MNELPKLVEANLDLIYRSLLKQIESSEGYGFHNKDQGHPVLYKSLKEMTPDEQSKANCAMFKLVSSIAQDLKRKDTELVQSSSWTDLSNWESFRLYSLKYHKPT